MASTSSSSSSSSSSGLCSSSAPGSPGSAGTAQLVAQLLAAGASEGLDLSSLTVEQWMRHHLSRLVKSAEDTVDDAVDSLLLTHKQAREELRNWQHQRSAEQALKHKAARKVTWNIRLTIEATGEEGGGQASVGRAFVLMPRQRNGGMCRIGRSTGADFQEPRGVSLPFDCSISVWHGKFTAVYGQVFYSDLNTRNGSLHNGTSVEKDQPILLADGDELSLGDVKLRVALESAAAGEEEGGQENSAGGGSSSSSSSSSSAGGR